MQVALITDASLIALVEVYAVRHGVSRSEALRRLVRTGLGFDPIGEKVHPRENAERARAVNRILIPDAYMAMFNDLRAKVGATEARRLVRDHAAVDAKRQRQ